jgi:integrase
LPSNIIRRHLHKALKELNYVNPYTGTYKAGNHAFRGFRNTYLRNHTDCPEGLYKYWMGHAGKDMSDLYDKMGSPQESDEVGILSGFLEGGEFGLGSG